MRISMTLIVLSFFFQSAYASDTLLREVDAKVSAPNMCRTAQPGEFMRLCDRFVTEHGAMRCIQIGRGQYFQDCSLSICHRYTTENGALECMQAIRNKRYAVDEINFCSRFSNERGVTDCLRSTGWPIDNGDDDQPDDGGDEPDDGDQPDDGNDDDLDQEFLKEVRREVGIAIYQIESGRSWQANSTLRSLMSRLNQVIEN